MSSRTTSAQAHESESDGLFYYRRFAGPDLHLERADVSPVWLRARTHWMHAFTPISSMPGATAGQRNFRRIAPGEGSCTLQLLTWSGQRLQVANA